MTKKSLLPKISFLNILIAIFCLLLLIVYSQEIKISFADLILSNQFFYKAIYFLLLLAPLPYLFKAESYKESKSLYRKLLLLSVAGFFLSTLFSVRCGINAGGFFFISSIIFLLKEKKIYQPPLSSYLFIAYFLIHLLSLLWSNDTSFGIYKLKTCLPFITFPIAFCFFRLKLNEIDTLLLIFFRGAFIVVATSLFIWFYESSFMNISPFEWPLLKKVAIAEQTPYSILSSWINYEHPTYNTIGYVLALAVGFFLSYKKDTESRISLFELFTYASSLLLLTMLLQSRVGLIVIIIVVTAGVAMLITRQSKKFLLGYTVVCFISAIILVSLFSDKINNFTQDPPREKLFSIAYSYITQNILLGTGIGGMTKIISSDEFSQALGYPEGDKVNIYPHNQFLGDFMQTGILGELILIAILASIFYVVWKKRKPLLLIFLLIFLLFMLIEMPFFILKGVTFFVPFSCLLLQKSSGSKKVILDFNRKKRTE